MKFYFFDLDLDPMTLVLKLDNIKMYVSTEKKVQWFKMYSLTNAERQTDRQKVSS